MKKRSKMVALGGILSALCVICLYLAVYLPTNRLFFYSLASIFVSFIVMESGIKSGWLFYIATSILSMLIIPNKIGIIPYLVFFGIYGIIKYYIESVNIIPIEIVLKGTYFIAGEGILYILYSRILKIDITTRLPIYVVFGIFLVIFYLYDYVYSRLIAFYRKRFMA
ncbi:MAG TPA: hypothetical protein VFD89_08000 [Clostridia bacterium]|nr:hypothetical protein [Clostridia bacterium]